MRTTHYQSGEAPRRGVAAAAHETFGRIAAQRPTPLRLAADRSEPEAVGPLASFTLGHAARARRARMIGDFLAAAWLEAKAAATRALGAWQRRRQQRATYLALRGLDDRTLHDLGFCRGEILSVALDIGRDDEHRRLRTSRAANALQLF